MRTFLDLRNAFHRVNREILPKKLEACGARGIVLQLLVSFLQNKKQIVKVDEKVSEVRDIKVESTTRICIGSFVVPPKQKGYNGATE